MSPMRGWSFTFHRFSATCQLPLWLFFLGTSLTLTPNSNLVSHFCHHAFGFQELKFIPFLNSVLSLSPRGCVFSNRTFPHQPVWALSFLPEAFPGELVIVCSSLECRERVVAKKLFQSSNPWVGFMDRAVLESELKGPFLEDTLEKAGVKSWQPVSRSRVGKEGWWSLRLKYIKYINLTSSSQWWLMSPVQRTALQSSAGAGGGQSPHHVE